MLDGECKIEFEKWYDEHEKEYEVGVSGGHTGKLHPSREWGVIEDFFDSVGLKIKFLISSNGDFLTGEIVKIDEFIRFNTKVCDTRPEARSAAKAKANELFNLRRESK